MEQEQTKVTLPHNSCYNILMDNKEIYKKTLTFSIRRLLWDVASFIIITLVSAAGFFLADRMADKGLIGLGVGVVIGIIIVAIISHFVSYVFKAGQIAMMTKAITDGKLPDDVYGEGKRIVKERFLTVAAYYAVTGVIKGIFQELGRVITKVGEAIGGENGGTVGSAISGVVQTIVAYLCDCCLGWVFYRKDEKASRATLEGAVLFFKHGKTLARNLGRIFGMGIVSFVIIGGVFFGISYGVLSLFPGMFDELADEFAKMAAEESNSLLQFLSDAGNITLAASGVFGVVMWGILHSVFIRPFVLVGVLRNYIDSGIKDTPNESDFAELDNKSKKFQKLHSEA